LATGRHCSRQQYGHTEQQIPRQMHWQLTPTDVSQLPLNLREFRARRDCIGAGISPDV
jgi:hypothetical protein